MAEMGRIDDAGIAEIEGALGVRLPREYVRWLLADPFDGRREAFYGYAGEIIDETLDLRRNGHLIGPWMATWVVIGNVGNGDYWFLDAALEESPVYATSHDGGPPVQVEAPNVTAWVEQLRADDAIPEDEWQRRHDEDIAKMNRVRDFFAMTPVRGRS